MVIVIVYSNSDRDNGFVTERSLAIGERLRLYHLDQPRKPPLRRGKLCDGSQRSLYHERQCYTSLVILNHVPIIERPSPS